MNGDSVPKEIIDRCIDDFEKLFCEKTASISARITAERVGASEFYISDMQGYLRGLIEMGNKSVAHFRKNLLGMG